MKHTVPTLTALALMAAPAFGATIADDLAIKPYAQLQARMQLGASGTDTAGNDYNIYNGGTGTTAATGGTSGGANDPLRFSLRRARFGVSAKNTTGWDATIQVRAGERADAGTGATSSQPVQLYYANVGKTFKSDAIENRISLGLDKPFNAESSISSSTYMLPSDRAVANLIEYRSVGLGWTLKGDFFKVGLNLADGGNWSNFSEANKSVLGTTVGTVPVIGAPAPQGSVGASSETKPGFFYSGRIEFSPGAAYSPAKKMESFAGAEGTAVVIGLDFQVDSKNLVASANNNATTAPFATARSQTTTIVGPDALVHWNGLSGLVEYRAFSVKQDIEGAGVANDDIKGSVFDIVVGYAFPLESGLVIEPALRYGKVDLNKDLDEGATQGQYASGEWQAGRVSGSEFGIGFNLYWNGHANKTQFAFTSWKGEDVASTTTGDAIDAKVFTVQHQVTF